MDYTSRSIRASEYTGAWNLSLPDDAFVYEVTIRGDLYQDIEACVSRWYSETTKKASDPNGYSTGIKENPSLNGAVGEVATATILYNEDNSVASASKPDDGWDFVYQGETHDVKTTEMRREMWITVSDVKNNQRIEYPLKADWYVAVREECRHPDGWMTVTILGRVRKEDVEKNTRIEDGKREKKRDLRHRVRKVPFSILEPMPEPPPGWQA